MRLVTTEHAVKISRRSDAGTAAMTSFCDARAATIVLASLHQSSRWPQ